MQRGFSSLLCLRECLYVIAALDFSAESISNHFFFLQSSSFFFSFYSQFGSALYCLSFALNFGWLSFQQWFQILSVKSMQNWKCNYQDLSKFAK